MCNPCRLAASLLSLTIFQEPVSSFSPSSANTPQGFKEDAVESKVLKFSGHILWRSKDSRMTALCPLRFLLANSISGQVQGMVIA